MAEAAQEAALELLRAAQRRGLLVGALGLLSLVGEAQRVGGVLEQRHGVVGHGAARPLCEQGARTRGGREGHREVGLAGAAARDPRAAVAAGRVQHAGGGAE